jgi:glucosamine-6-phosphate deaminase
VRIDLSPTKHALGQAAAACAAEGLRQALAERGRANLIVATGASQFEMLQALTAADGIDWARVTAFHLDEYIGLPVAHPASFRAYLRQRFVAALPGRLAAFHEVDGENPDPAAECRRLGELIARHPIDVACIGIGENGHLAFNDPPADFDAKDAYLVVTLDEACRRQQLGEGWFPTFDDVPRQALSMSIPQILKSARIVCTVPDARKATAVRDAVGGPLTNLCPASVLRTHAACTLFLDPGSASLLAQHP